MKNGSHSNQITRQTVAEKLADYLQGRITLAALVDWSENQMMEGDFESSVVTGIVARLGLADEKSFELTWEDCQSILRQLGYSARVEIEA